MNVAAGAIMNSGLCTAAYGRFCAFDSCADRIADPNGASSLLTNLKSTDAPDPKTVIFHLKEPDVTWPALLTAMSFAIVPSDVFPKDKLQPDAKVIGSGRYTVASYEPGQQTVLEKNPAYTGVDPAKNDRAIIQYFDKASALKLAVEQGDVDLAYRNLSPTDFDDLRNTSGVNVIGGKGIEIRYLVFNENLQPGANDAQKLAIRRAAAYMIDRNAIVSNVYSGTVQPLYSMIPQGLDYAAEPFKDEYGASPNPTKAKSELQKAGVNTPVPLEIWWTPTHYGPVSGDEYAEIKHQLEDGGLFTVTLKSTEWDQYSEAALTDKYPQYQLGFFPDYPEPDDYASNLWGSQSFLNDHYSNPQVDKLLAQKEAELGDRTEQLQALAEETEFGIALPTSLRVLARAIRKVQEWLEEDREGRDENAELPHSYPPARLFWRYRLICGRQDWNLSSIR